VRPLGRDYRLVPFSPFPEFVDTGVTLVDKDNVDAILKNESVTAGGTQ
jgi:ribose transport system substrate-binding protein